MKHKISLQSHVILFILHAIRPSETISIRIMFLFNLNCFIVKYGHQELHASADFKTKQEFSQTQFK